MSMRGQLLSLLYLYNVLSIVSLTALWGSICLLRSDGSHHPDTTGCCALDEQLPCRFHAAKNLFEVHFPTSRCPGFLSHSTY